MSFHARPAACSSHAAPLEDGMKKAKYIVISFHVSKFQPEADNIAGSIYLLRSDEDLDKWKKENSGLYDITGDIDCWSNGEVKYINSTLAIKGQSMIFAQKNTYLVVEL